MIEMSVPCSPEFISFSFIMSSISCESQKSVFDHILVAYHKIFRMSIPFASLDWQNLLRAEKKFQRACEKKAIFFLYIIYNRENQASLTHITQEDIMRKITEMRFGQMAVSEVRGKPCNRDSIFRLLIQLQVLYRNPENQSRLFDILGNATQKGGMAETADMGLRLCILKDQYGFVLEHHLME